MRTSLVFALLLGALSGCGKTARPTPSDSAGGTDGSASAGAPGTPEAGGMAGSGDSVSSSCDSPTPGPKPLLRWGNYQLGLALADLLAKAPTLKLPSLPRAAEDASQSAYRLSDVQALHAWAHEAALAASRTAIATCPEGSKLEACRDDFIDSFASQAYRRPLTDEEHADLVLAFSDGYALGGDFQSGARAAMEVTLQSPDFLYLIEQGNGRREGDATALTGYESAARLAYFLTGTGPDEELRRVAAAGELDADTLQRQGDRLAFDEGFIQAYSRILGIKAFPSEAGSDADSAETRGFLTVTLSAGTFRALLTQHSNPGLDGVLTLPAFLRQGSHGATTSPVMRGLTVLEQLLCRPVPRPPVRVPPLEPDSNSTTRELLEQATVNPACQSCHRELNALGFAFEKYDAQGAPRDSENGKPIDASGELMLDGAEVHFDGAVQLEQVLVESPTAHACFVSGMLGQANGRAGSLTEQCSQAQVLAAFEASGGDMKETMRAIVRTDGFRYRLTSELHE